MKKRNGLIALSLLLGIVTSCGGNETEDKPSETPKTPEEILKIELDKAKVGYNLESTYVTENSTGKITGLVDSGFKDGKYYAKQFATFLEGETPSKDGKSIFETYTKDKDGYATKARLNVNNEKTYFKILDVTAPEGVDPFFKFDPYYDNFFKTLNVEDFEKEVTDGSNELFTLKTEALTKDLVNLIGTQIYGNQGFNVTKLELELIEEKLATVNTTLTFGTGDKLATYEFNSKVTAIGDEALFLDNAPTFETVEDKDFETMLETLKGKNFTCEVLDTGFEGVKSLVVTDKGVSFTNTTGTYSYFVKENKLHEAIYSNGEYFDGGETTEFETLEELYSFVVPSFAINRAVFDKPKADEFKYVMKEEVKDGYISCVAKFTETSVEDLDEFSVSKVVEGNKTNYVFTNSDGMDDVTITFKELGTSNLPFDVNSLPEANFSANLKEAVAPEALESLIGFLGEDLVNNLPSPVPNAQKGSFFDFYADQPEFKDICMVLMDGVSTFTEENIYPFLEGLLNLEFMESEVAPVLTTDGLMLEKVINNKKIFIEICALEEIYCIGIYTEAFLELA